MGLHLSFTLDQTLQKSRKNLEQYVSENLPSHYVGSVPGDGLCILYSFRDELRDVCYKVLEIEELKRHLRQGVDENYQLYKGFMVDNVDIYKELYKFFQDPLAHYTTSIADVFLAALGNYHKCHIKVI